MAMAIAREKFASLFEDIHYYVNLDPGKLTQRARKRSTIDEKIGEKSAIAKPARI